MRARANVWRREAIDLIDYVRDSERDTVWQPRNLTDATFNGLELQLEWRRPLPWVHRASLSYAYIDAQLGSPNPTSDLISRYALDQLRHQVTARGTLRLSRKFSLTAAYRYADRTNDPLPVSGGIAPLPVDYQLLDVQIGYRSEQWTGFVAANNMLDEAYAQTNGVPLPGRWFRFGGSFTLTQRE